MTEPLKKVDSAVQGIASSPAKDAKESAAKARRASSAAAPGVMNVKDLGTSWSAADNPSPHPPETGSVVLTCQCTEEEGIDLKIAGETQKLGW